MLIDSERLKQDIFTFMPERSEVLLIVDSQPDGIVRCKDYDNRECDGRAGTIVCGITGDSHSRLWFCADGEMKEGDVE